MLELLSELCDTLESVLAGRAPWQHFQAWGTQRAALLIQLSQSIFVLPYCEPGKVAGAAATCLLLLAESQDSSHQEQLVECVKDIDGLLQATADAEKNKFDTRLHMFLRSPWPTFRILDLLVQLFPSDEALAAPDLGLCIAHKDWMGQPLEFNWQWFKEALTSALIASTESHDLFELSPDDGPLAEQYRARWTRVYGTPAFRESAAFGSAAFYKFRRNQWEAGCNPGIVASYLMQVVTFCTRDTEAWLQRYIGASWRLLNLLSPLPSLVFSDWPVFRALYLGSLLRRHPQPWRPGRLDLEGESQERLQADGGFPVQALQEEIRSALATKPPQVAYVTSVWGHLARFLKHYLARWSALALPFLVVLALDEEATDACREASAGGEARWVCIGLAQHFGVEAFVAKYIAMAVMSDCVPFAIWLDFDVYLPVDPTPRIQSALLSAAATAPLAFAGSPLSQSLNPCIIAARGPEASRLLLRHAMWLFEHPYILDHQGWDSFLQNRDGDFSGNWDYKGRNITSAPDDGLQISFAPGAASWNLGNGPRFVVLDHAFASGDGFFSPPEHLLAFHFWGTRETQGELFSRFYPHEKRGFGDEARALLLQYHRVPAAVDTESVAGRARQRSHLTAISYAHGCCVQSIQRNRQSALDVGADEAHAYGAADLDETWAATHVEVLSQRKGAGWWLWKPYLILRTLKDDAVPWHTGVVLWLDAGNYYVGDPQPVIARALRDSDVAAMRLKCCVESDWTSARALRKMNGSGYSIADRPQLGAYFIVLRKTPVAIAFAEEWLRLAEDPEILTEDSSEAETNMQASPGYQRHMADQSIFSVLFKQRGFEALSLEEGHRVVQLDRWRE